MNNKKGLIINNNKGNSINNSLNNNSNNNITYPIISYKNVDIQKIEILKANKRKTGIYIWTHKESGKSYVGSAMDLSRRLSNYYSFSYLKTKKINSRICNALLKYGYSNFSLDILEHCEPSLLISREQYFIDLLNPEYNILKIAGNSLGFKHSEMTKAKMSINNTGKKHSYETRKK